MGLPKDLIKHSQLFEEVMRHNFRSYDWLSKISSLNLSVDEFVNGNVTQNDNN